MKNSHRLFIQALMSKGVMNGKEIYSLLKQATEKYDEYVAQYQEDQRKLLVDFVHHINDRLKVFGMEVRKGVDELTGVGCYGLVNITESSITLLASHYTENELQFFKKLVEMLVLSDTGCVGSIEAVHISDSLQKKMSKTDAEDLLDKLQQERWIGKTEGGKIYLAARGLMEFEQYVFDMFGEAAVRCFVCKKLAVQGETCEECNTRLHFHCEAKLNKDKKEKKCPECRAQWGGAGRVLQKSTEPMDEVTSAGAEGTDMDMPETNKKTTTTQSRRKRKATDSAVVLYTRTT